MSYRYVHKKAFALMMSFLLVLSVIGTSLVPAAKAGAAPAADPVPAVSVTQAIYEAANQIVSGGVDSDWEAVGLAKAGRTIPSGYIADLEQRVKDIYPIVTEYERISLAIAAVGGDATSFGGTNLIEHIYNDSMQQGVNALLFGLLALDSRQYDIPDDATWSRDKLVSEILSKQKADGGFAFFGSTSDPDLTAMALTALAPYTNKPEVKTAGEKITEWLSLNQEPHGGYNLWGTDSSESVAQAIIALTANGIDPTGERFTKQGVDLLDKLMTFRNADGGFSHALPGSSDGMATEQALQALVAYDTFTKGAGRLYSFAPLTNVSLQVEGPQSAIAEGDQKAVTALQALEKLAKERNIPIAVTDSSFGKYVSAIAGVTAATYGGYDGWLYAVQRGGNWDYPMVGMADYGLKPSDRIVVYYGDGDTQLVKAVSVQPEQPKAGDRFTVSVTKTSLDWMSNQEVVVPAAGVQVAIGSKHATTNEQGIATFENGVPAGAYTAVITGYRDNKTPLIVRSTQALTVAVKPVDPGNNSGSGTSSPSAALPPAEAVDDFAKIALPADNTKPVDPAGITTFIKNAADKMSAEQAEQLRKLLADNKVQLSRAAASDAETVISDAKEEVRLVVPASALSQSVTIGIAELPSDRPELVSGLYDFTPDGTTFAKPVYLSIKISYLTDKPENLAFVWLDEKTGRWIPVPAVFDARTGVITGKTTHFTKYAVIDKSKLANVSVAEERFADEELISSWASAAVHKAYKLKLMTGMSDTELRFAPNLELTRAQFAAILLRMLNEAPAADAKPVFKDVEADTWYFGYVMKAKEKGIVDGAAPDAFLPEKAVTREEMAVMLARAYGLTASSSSQTFEDQAEIADYALPFVRAVYERGIMVGDNGYFRPGSKVTREMAAVVAVNAVQD
ncbi:S-layer homology domain-containing protein [Paenibacillus sp. MBLB4367]|uniref:S-layer homology domain-containing protein n=1 Tax=Paenibacillus sp. MBLB4367 TaxID=3384767 RepID=UPI0039083CE1